MTENQISVELLKRRLAELETSQIGRQQEAQRSGGGSGGDSMEPRLATLEADVRHIKDDLGELKKSFAALQGDTTSLRIDVARINENIRHLPTKEFLVGAVITTLAVITGLLTFQDKIQQAFRSFPPAVSTTTK
jgi:archaellum component FlaC